MLITTRAHRSNAACHRTGIAIGLVVLAMLMACGESETQGRGTPVMPADFGPPATRLFGCEEITGLYAWPPVQGEADIGVPRTTRAFKLPFLVPISTPLYAEAQIWVASTSTGVIDVRSRMVNRNPNLRISALTNGWSQSELTSSELRCEDDAWVYAPPAAQEGEARARYEAFLAQDTGAERVELGIRLQPLANGDLAVGQWQRWVLRAPGRRGPPEAGDSVFDPPPSVVWRWSRLQRLGETGEGVPSDDAAMRAR